MSSISSSRLKGLILDAAIEILNSDGIGAVTVRAVASRAGCSTIGVYTHFTDKPGLIEAIVLEGFEDFGFTLSEATTRAGREGLVQSAVAYRDWALANRTRYLVMFSPAIPGFGRRDEVNDATARVFADHAARVADAVARGEMTGDVSALAAHLWATVHGHVILEINGNTGDAAAYRRALTWVFEGTAVSQ